MGRSAVPPPGFRPAGDEPPAYEPPGYQPPGYGPAGYEPPIASGPPGYPPPPGHEYPQLGTGAPRGSNVPLLAVIVAIAVLLCGGTATATVLAVRNAADRAREAVAPITHPSVPAVPTDAPKAPQAPTTVPDLPTGLPSLPGLPTLPSGWPNLSGEGSTITIAYEVTGDGPVEILYAERVGETPKRIRPATLPWKTTTKMDGTALVLVMAVRVGPEPGSISCRATVDGRQVAQNTHEGRYVSVTCSKLIIAQ